MLNLINFSALLIFINVYAKHKNHTLVVNSTLMLEIFPITKFIATQLIHRWR